MNTTDIKVIKLQPKGYVTKSNLKKMTEKIILSEIYQLPESLKMEVLHFIAFLKQEYQSPKTKNKNTDRVFGRSKGRYVLASDFDAPLEDFNEYQ